MKTVGPATSLRTSCWLLPQNHCQKTFGREFLMCYGRGEVANYHRNLLSAVEIWRRSGVWRVPFDES
jgi:hypothetical protein